MARPPRFDSFARSCGCKRSPNETASCRPASKRSAPRAAGTACGTNPIPIVVPCHRVLRSGGGLGGYGGGLSMEKPDEGLPKIAAATGGGYFELNSGRELALTFSRVADELHHQYALGFAPEKLDGKMHDLTLHVSKPGLTARARKRYLASKS